MAVNASRAVAQKPGGVYNPLFIYGGQGLGKTHLMQAIGHDILARSGASVRFLPCETMFHEYIMSLKNTNGDAFRNQYRNTDVLLVDDVQFLSNKDTLQEEFFHVFNQFFNARKQIVMTSDTAPHRIAGLETRLIARFEWGLMVEISPPELETRLAILHMKQEMMNLSLDENILLFMASHIAANTRGFEGALHRLAAYASINQQTITLDLVKSQLQDILVANERY